MTGTLQERFEAKVDRLPGLGPDGSCHEWTAGRYRDGYGRIRVGGRILRAHRVAWEFERGPIPEGQQVLHKCDNPPCVREDHLFLGTQAENIADMNAKGRGNQPKGSDHGSAKLTEEEIPEIRSLLAHGAPGRFIARIYGVSDTLISNINTGKAWKHV
jgi:hypothetical protein